MSMKENALSEVERLQEEINRAVQQEPLAALVSIRLSKWSDVVDLAAYASARVAVSEREAREFTIISQAWVGLLFDAEWGVIGGQMEDAMQDVYCSGGPLIIVKQINGVTTVRGVINFLCQEGTAPSFQHPD